MNVKAILGSRTTEKVTLAYEMFYLPMAEDVDLPIMPFEEAVSRGIIGETARLVQADGACLIDYSIQDGSVVMTRVTVSYGGRSLHQTEAFLLGETGGQILSGVKLYGFDDVILDTVGYCLTDSDLQSLGVDGSMMKAVTLPLINTVMAKATTPLREAVVRMPINGNLLVNTITASVAVNDREIDFSL